MRVRSTGDTTLELHDLGGDGDPLLVCHATGFCGRAYEPLAVALRPQFHVWAIDFRGHGDSTSPSDGDFAWTGMADDVLAAADVLGRSSLRGVGHSMGGAALLQAELARPGLLRSAYLYEPTISPRGFPREAAARLMAAAARRRRSMFPSRFDALVQYANRPPLNVLRGDALLAYVEHGFGELPGGSVHLKCAPEAEASTFESEPKMTIDLAEGVAVPTTVAVGQRVSEPDVAQFGPALVAAMPHARLLAYAHLGHFGPLQDPDTVAEDIIESARLADQQVG